MLHAEVPRILRDGCQGASSFYFIIVNCPFYDFLFMIISQSIDTLIFAGEADDHGNEYGNPGTHGCGSLIGQEDN